MSINCDACKRGIDNATLNVTAKHTQAVTIAARTCGKMTSHARLACHPRQGRTP